jgi:hypothetical protein
MHQNIDGTCRAYKEGDASCTRVKASGSYKETYVVKRYGNYAVKYWYGYNSEGKYESAIRFGKITKDTIKG